MQGQLVKATQEWASLLTNLQWQKVARVAPKWIAFAMAILIAKSAADLTWLILTPSPRTTGNTTRYQGLSADHTEQVRLSSVSNLHLFGIAIKPAANAGPIKAKETHLKLTLRGVFASDNPKQALAIIESAQGQQKVYREGDSIFSGVRLYAVYPDRVILERSGNYETLSLPRDKNNLVSSGVRIVRPRRYSYSPGEASPNGSPIVTRTVQGGVQLRALRNQLMQHPQQFWQNVRIEPRYNSSNRVMGYTFQYNNSGMMQALGLRPGDVIVSVDGQPVTDPSVMTSLMSKLSRATSIRLGVERNGQRENLNINM